MNMTLQAHSAAMPTLAETIFVPEAAAHANTNSAFFSSSGIKALRRFNGALCRVAPGAAAALARRLIATPPRHAPRAWEKEPTPNLTGSTGAYRPAGALERGGRRAAATGWAKVSPA